MVKIRKIKGRQVFDSRGNPTVEAEVFSDKDTHTLAIVPSGASTGKHEAFELRDKENKNYLGKSVFKAVENINGPIAKALINMQRIFGPGILERTGFESMVEMIMKIAMLKLPLSEVAMELDSSLRKGKSKMKFLRTIKGYLDLWSYKKKWLKKVENSKI